MAYRKIIFIILVFLFIPCSSEAAWKYNPFTKKQDYYSGKSEIQTYTAYKETFVDGDLNANNQLTVTHSLNTTHIGSVIVYDPSNIPVTGYTVTPIDANSVTLDMIGFGTLEAGNWTIEILSGD